MDVSPQSRGPRPSSRRVARAVNPPAETANAPTGADGWQPNGRGGRQTVGRREKQPRCLDWYVALDHRAHPVSPVGSSKRTWLVTPGGRPSRLNQVGGRQVHKENAEKLAQVIFGLGSAGRSDEAVRSCRHQAAVRAPRVDGEHVLTVRGERKEPRRTSRPRRGG
jgi:hypothetical protein